MSTEGGGLVPDPRHPDLRDPSERAREEARYTSDQGSLPSESGLGPGAGEGPGVAVETDHPSTHEDVPRHATLRDTGPPEEDGGKHECADPDPDPD